MALVVNDRVKETSTTTGTGVLTLAGAVTGFETFSSAIGNTNTTYYAIVNTVNAEFEVGLGTVGAGTLTRTTVISSSNSDSAVDFAAGTKNVFCTLPASKSVILDASGNIVANNGSNLTDLNATNLASGTVPDARFPATLPALNGSALTALNATQLTSGTVPDARFPSTLPASNGSNLTNLNATALATGTVANARLDAQLQDVAGLATTSGKIIQGDGSNFVLSAYTLPTADGTAGKVLTTNGSGAVTFETPTTGDITAVTAGSGLTGGGASGDVTLNVGAGTGVTVNANDIAIGQSVATSASPTFAGLTTTADINFGDNDKAVFGAGSDLQIYHDGSNSYVNDTGTGALFLNSDGTKVAVHASGEKLGEFNLNGSVDLYHNNVKKFETTSSGIQTTGTVNVNGAYTLPTSDGSANQVLTTDGSGAVTFATPTTGDITGVTAGSGLTGGGTTGDVTLNVGAGALIDVTADAIDVDLSELTTSTSNGDGDFFVVVDSSNNQKKLTKGNINNSGFNNDAGYTTNVGDITGVTAGSGLTGGGASGSVTLNVGAGTGIDVSADAIAVDVSDFMTNGSNNRIVTATGTDGMNAEANMTFDGSTLTVTGAVVPGATDTYDLGASGNVWRNIYTGDLHLSNEAKDEGNAIDGTKGNWTIQEGAEHLYILNNKSGKKYKFKLEEI